MSEVRESSDGRRFMVINGERVYLGSRRHGSDESGSVRPHKSSNSDSKSRSPPKSQHSDPSHDRHESRESRHSRHGYDEQVYGERGGRGSDPGPGARDYYRETLERDPPPRRGRGNKFRDDYEDYKDDDAYAEGSDDNYSRFRESAGRYSRRERNASPGIYRGNPPETREWHGRGAEYAGRASDDFQEAAESRREHGRDYIGYDTARGARGHRQRADNLESSSRRYDRKKGEHERHAH